MRCPACRAFIRGLAFRLCAAESPEDRQRIYAGAYLDDARRIKHELDLQRVPVADARRVLPVCPEWQKLGDAVMGCAAESLMGLRLVAKCGEASTHSRY
jgi:hypothetical protein